MGEIINFASKINTEETGGKDLGLEVEKPKRGPKQKEKELDPKEALRLGRYIWGAQNKYEHTKDRELKKKYKKQLDGWVHDAKLRGFEPNRIVDQYKLQENLKRIQEDQMKQTNTRDRASADEIRKQIGLSPEPPKNVFPKTTTELRKVLHDTLADQQFEPVSASTHMSPTDKIQPADMELARFSAEADSTPEPKSFWGKFKSWLSGESAYRKYGEMQADSGKTADDLRAEDKGEAMMYRQDKAEVKAKEKRDFNLSMKDGSAQAKSDYFNEKAIETEISGPFAEKGHANMEKYNDEIEKMSDRLSELQPIVGEIRLGFFTKLKIDKKSGFITNLPENNENIVFDFLIKQKEKMGAKGKIAEANKIVEQMEALEEYIDLLAKREKLKAEAGQLDTGRR